MHIHVPASFESSLNLPKGSSKTVLHFHHVGGFIVFDLDGPLAMPWVADELLAVVQQMLDNGTKNLIIDLADVPYADSAGVGALMAARTLIEGTGGNLVLFQAARPIMDMLKRMRLENLFTFSDDLAFAAPEA